jgi:PAP2 superfamily
MSARHFNTLKKKGATMTYPKRVATLLVATITLVIPCNSRADIVTDWNVTATTLTPAAGKNGIQQSRIYAMVHAATHDALNAIERRYRPYRYDARVFGASPEAAVAAAAHDVMVAEIPTQQSALDAAYTSSLSGIPDGSAKNMGIAVGQAAAAAILALRSADGSSAVVPYTPGSGPGAWVPTPPAFAPALLPGWGNVTPFTLNTGDQFRPDPPEFFELTSEEFARDYNEVKSIGDANSTTRTAEQSEIARFWYEGSPVGWNRIGRIVSTQAGLGLWENARLFALLNLALADGYIASFNTKYAYNFWRPVTAIRAGDTDGNPDTSADPAWTSYLVTPPMPDYTSAHSVEGGAAAEVLASFLGTDYVSFTTTSGAPFPGITRSFTSFSQAARENADSRVYAGIHWRTACTDGLSQGEKIGKFAFKHFLKPVE